MRVTVKTNNLTDGSETHDVIVHGPDEDIHFAAMNYEHALRLSEQLEQVISVWVIDRVGS